MCVKMNNSIASDSSFYICFSSDLKRKDWLYKFVNLYSFYIGKRIKNEIKEWINKLGEIIEAKKIISMDGMGKFCMVADGSADFYVREMNLDYSFSWDYMPGDLLVREAGGTVTDLNEVNLTFEKKKCKWTAPSIIVSNGILHDDIISNIKKIIQ